MINGDQLIYIGFAVVIIGYSIFALIKRHQMGPTLLKIFSLDLLIGKIFWIIYFCLLLLNIFPFHKRNFHDASHLPLTVKMIFLFMLTLCYLAIGTSKGEFRAKGILTPACRAIVWHDIHTYFWTQLLAQDHLVLKYEKASIAGPSLLKLKISIKKPWRRFSKAT